MNMTASPLNQYIKRKSKEALRLKMNSPLGCQNTTVDFFNLKNSKFTMVPIAQREREERMHKVKSNLDLSFMNKCDNKAIVGNQRMGDDRDGIVFKKVNPVTHINTANRPNSFSWNPDQFNKRIVGKMIADYEAQEKLPKLYEELNKKIQIEKDKILKARETDNKLV